MDERREVLVHRMRQVRENIREWFDAIEHWNAIHPDEEPLDQVKLDSDGTLTKMAIALDQSLANEDRIRAQEAHGIARHEAWQ